MGHKNGFGLHRGMAVAADIVHLKGTDTAVRSIMVGLQRVQGLTPE